MDESKGACQHCRHALSSTRMYAPSAHTCSCMHAHIHAQKDAQTCAGAYARLHARILAHTQTNPNGADDLVISPYGYTRFLQDYIANPERYGRSYLDRDHTGEMRVDYMDSMLMYSSKGYGIGHFLGFPLFEERPFLDGSPQISAGAYNAMPAVLKSQQARMQAYVNAYFCAIV